MTKLIVKQKESEILTAICKYLALKKYFWWRQNNGGVWDEKRGAYRTNKNTMPGVPDIFLIGKKQDTRNHFWAIEVKTLTGRQSPEQKEFERQWLSHGGIYLLARSVDNVINAGL